MPSLELKSWTDSYIFAGDTVAPAIIATSGTESISGQSGSWDPGSNVSNWTSPSRCGWWWSATVVSVSGTVPISSHRRWSRQKVRGRKRPWCPICRLIRLTLKLYIYFDKFGELVYFGTFQTGHVRAMAGCFFTLQGCQSSYF